MNRRGFFGRVVAGLVASRLPKPSVGVVEVAIKPLVALDAEATKKVVLECFQSGFYKIPKGRTVVHARRDRGEP